MLFGKSVITIQGHVKLFLLGIGDSDPYGGVLSNLYLRFVGFLDEFPRKIDQFLVVLGFLQLEFLRYGLSVIIKAPHQMKSKIGNGEHHDHIPKKSELMS